MNAGTHSSTRGGLGLYMSSRLWQVRGASPTCPIRCSTLGWFFILRGAGFIAKNIMVVAMPQYDVPYVFLPMFLAWFYGVLWLFLKGVDRARWDAMQGVADPTGR